MMAWRCAGAGGGAGGVISAAVAAAAGGGASLRGCLRRFVRPEELGRRDHWECSRCLAIHILPTLTEWTLSISSLLCTFHFGATGSLKHVSNVIVQGLQSSPQFRVQGGCARVAPTTPRAGHLHLSHNQPNLRRSAPRPMALPCPWRAWKLSCIRRGSLALNGIEQSI